MAKKTKLCSQEANDMSGISMASHKHSLTEA